MRAWGEGGKKAEKSNPSIFGKYIHRFQEKKIKKHVQTSKLFFIRTFGSTENQGSIANGNVDIFLCYNIFLLNTKFVESCPPLPLCIRSNMRCWCYVLTYTRNKRRKKTGESTKKVSDGFVTRKTPFFFPNKKNPPPPFPSLRIGQDEKENDWRMEGEREGGEN